LKKSAQKTFANWAPGVETSTVQVEPKVFWLLFFKKVTAFFPLICHTQPQWVAA
jgi:hypothetical protein